MLDKIFIYGLKLFGMFLLPISIAYAIHHFVETNYLNCVLSIPLFWQYDVDSILELGTATYFPEIFREIPTRVTRPMYPFIANSLGHFFNFLSPIKFDFIYFVVFSFLSSEISDLNLLI